MLSDVLYVPELHGNFLSVPQITKRGAEVRFKGNKCRIFNGSETLTKASCVAACTLCVEVLSPPTLRVAPLGIFRLPTEGEYSEVPESALAAKFPLPQT